MRHVTRTLSAVAVLGLAVSPVPRAQEVAPAFEVASVRPSESTGLSLWNWYPSRFTARRVTVRTLIAIAYDVPAHLIEGGAGWTRSEAFDILATLPEGTTPGDRPLMLRALLADRFGLVVHEETRDAEAYDLLMARDDGRLGPGLTRPDDRVDCEQIIAERRATGESFQILREAASLLRSGPVCDTTQWNRGYEFAWEAGRRSIADLADYLSQRLKRPVIDRTDLTGDFDFRLEYVAPEASALEPSDQRIVAERPDLFAALEEQLGLKLESSRGPVTFLVIDAVTRPEPN